MAKPKTKILVVEDESLLLGLYQAKFLREGYEVLIADNGAKGFDMATQHLPDFILLDIIMREVDGYEMLKRLKADKKTKNIPVVIFSNLSQKHEIEKGLKLGANDFIIKTSVTPTELVKRVEEYLKKFKK
ncbi:MAG: hypothetical protein A3J62_01690 [Candidatus Buchananbacteria bacterium RIFCSPHIGHO2_02_FULL_38_8]|uniref:Response regulatory domain-containing protein n=2 Tax=Candidatus Buchananiibacteriota TaxID=1817903 RepID=A0A1G1XVD8_9BACT|nr:MAG: hypothetical protein A2731_03040 [Candidatus Buchananbacteria bacterium RIFCSPHIGHO2_01_FULL_39_8]OGY47581.1 MAG: hypothetical protein A3J62_01690 [Candidatus Buchananbacteria bacterium RIFCSPHIGHO2_02_FULL_38_8]